MGGLGRKFLHKLPDMETLRNLESPFVLWIQIDIYFLASTTYLGVVVGRHPVTGTYRQRICLQGSAQHRRPNTMGTRVPRSISSWLRSRRRASKGWSMDAAVAAARSSSLRRTSSSSPPPPRKSPVRISPNRSSSNSRCACIGAPSNGHGVDPSVLASRRKCSGTLRDTARSGAARRAIADPDRRALCTPGPCRIDRLAWRRTGVCRHRPGSKAGAVDTPCRPEARCPGRSVRVHPETSHRAP